MSGLLAWIWAFRCLSSDVSMSDRVQNNIWRNLDFLFMSTEYSTCTTTEYNMFCTRRNGTEYSKDPNLAPSVKTGNFLYVLINPFQWSAGRGWSDWMVQYRVQVRILQYCVSNQLKSCGKAGASGIEASLIPLLLNSWRNTCEY